jgi:hypothetical protein
MRGGKKVAIMIINRHTHLYKREDLNNDFIVISRFDNEQNIGLPLNLITRLYLSDNWGFVIETNIARTGRREIEIGNDDLFFAPLINDFDGLSFGDRFVKVEGKFFSKTQIIHELRRVSQNTQPFNDCDEAESFILGECIPMLFAIGAERTGKLLNDELKRYSLDYSLTSRSQKLQFLNGLCSRARSCIEWHIANSLPNYKIKAPRQPSGTTPQLSQ